MPDKEKVIEGLETIKQFFGYGLPSTAEMFDSYYGILNDAIAMLKEQETTSTGKTRIFQCEKCGYGIDDIFISDEHNYSLVPKFCPNCGRKVGEANA